MTAVSHLSPKQKTMMAMDKRLKVAKCLGANPEGMTATEMAAKLGMTAREVEYVLHSLVSHGEAEKVYRRKVTE